MSKIPDILRWCAGKHVAVASWSAVQNGYLCLLCGKVHRPSREELQRIQMGVAPGTDLIIDLDGLIRKEGKPFEFKISVLPSMARARDIYYEADPHAVEYTHLTRDSAISYYLVDMEPSGWPDELEVTQYSPKLLEDTQYAADGWIDEFLDDLREEYGEGDERSVQDGSDASAFHLCVEATKAVYDRYTPYECEEIDTVTVNTREWIKKHRPLWLDYGGAKAWMEKGD